MPDAPSFPMVGNRGNSSGNVSDGRTAGTAASTNHSRSDGPTPMSAAPPLPLKIEPITECFTTGPKALRNQALRAVIPVLHARDIRHPVVGSVPAVEPVHFQERQARDHIADHDEAVVVADVDSERTVEVRSPRPGCRW